MPIAPSSKRRLYAALFTLIVLGSVEPLFAQGADASELVPPRLLETALPEYPPEEKARGAVAIVVLMLDIDDGGRVTRALVTTSGGPSFDSAALAAAARLHFAPASRAGGPIRSKIPFQFAFTLAPEDADVGDAATADDDASSSFVDIEVRGERSPRETTKQVLERAEIATMPGTNGDALHAVENLPGVARPSGISSNLVVRGSGPQDTGVFADGVWLVNAFHFGGITSVVPTEVLERLDFYPGNFSPEYGRQMGGIIDLGIRSPRKDRFGGLVQFDLLDGRLLAEGPLGPTTRFLVAGRRSWVDAWLGSALRSAGAGVSIAPVYYDYQAMIEQDLSRSTTVRLLFFGADDRFALNVGSPSAGDPGLGGEVGQSETFLRLQARMDSRFSERTRWINMVSLGNNGEHFALGNNKADATYKVIDSRSDLRAQLSRSVTAVAGITCAAMPQRRMSKMRSPSNANSTRRS